MPSPEELQMLPREALRPASVRLTAGANSGGTQPDGIAALAVGTALALGIYLRKKGHGGQRMLTTMLLSAAHSLSETMIEYLDSQPPAAPAQADSEAFGFGALYRLYQASDGWIFLGAPAEREWSRLVAALGRYVDLAGDPRFADEASRQRNDGDLAAELARVFATRTAHEWESELLGADVGCVVAENTTMEETYLGPLGQQAGYLTDAESPVFDVYPRVGPLVRFSRSRTQSLGGCTNGQHTEAVLAEIGYSAEQFAALRAQGRIG
jgi:crotonobetainyl-CoA:carnitine CoA-transferase CaiB-like acyl-CoA transferase